MNKLQTSFGRLKLDSPVIAGSSGLTDNLENLMAFENAGAGAIVLKSLFEEEIVREMQTQLSGMGSGGFIYPETLEFYDYFDGPKETTTSYLELIQNAKKAIHIPVIASINCIDSENWTYFPKQVEQAGADALELNIFILPSDFQRSSADNEKTCFDIIQAVTEQLKIPVFVKLSYYSSNLAGFLKKISQTGIDGLVLFNRFYNPDIDINTLEINSGAILSSASDIYMPLRWIAIMAEKCDCDLAASTGVQNAEAAIKLLLAGASAVQVVSACYKNGIPFISTINEGIESWMATKGFNSIAEFKGMLSQSRSENPAVYARVQFMKYFRGFQLQ